MSRARSIQPWVAAFFIGVRFVLMPWLLLGLLLWLYNDDGSDEVALAAWRPLAWGWPFMVLGMLGSAFEVPAMLQRPSVDKKAS